MTSRVHIDLGALADNYQTFREAGRPGQVGAVVKADAYGLGATTVGRTLWAAGCRHFFVATALEGASLRAALPDVAIYVFEGARVDTVDTLLANGLTPVLNHEGQAEVWRAAGGGQPAAIHIDTGINRLGFPHQATSRDFRGLRVSLLMTHLACADEPAHPMNALQLERFARVRELFPGVPVSIGNSARVLSGASCRGDIGRPGIGLYGGNPFVPAPGPDAGPSPVRPVVTLEGCVLQVRRVRAGESVGYGGAFDAATDMQVAIVGLGYADGLPRLLSNRGEAAVAGRRCAIVGRVSMDLTAVDVTGCPVKPGDWVEFFGASVLVDEVAAWSETIPYEVLTGLGARPVRQYLRG